MLGGRAREFGVPIAFCNLVGGQDELIFDGHSFVVGADGEVVARGRQFVPDLLLWELGGGPGRIETPLADLDELYEALVLGVRDYTRKNGFERVLIGLSGGIDSALVALVAADALGPERVTCVVMPSPHSSPDTQADARAIARNLGTELIELPIEAAMRAYGEILGQHWSGAGLAAENVQARIRGNLLMALSNDRGALVLTTGNKSEMSVGYATLYGDMAGGLAVIKDVPKLARLRAGPPPQRHRHRRRRPGLGDRAPAVGRAARRPARRGLAAALRAARPGARGLRRARSVARGARRRGPATGGRRRRHPPGRPAEYKRRQSPPGIRITSKAFGRDRRLPITNRFGG